MEVEGDSVISGAQLHDVIINNAILCGDIKGGGLDIPIDEITKAIDEISAGYISKDEALEESITANKDSIDALDKKLSDKIDEVQKTATGDTTALEERLSSAFAEASAYLDKRITSEMSAETSARISADAEISKTLTEHHDKIGILLDRCETLNELALSVDENSVERHEDMLQKLAEHDEKNEQRFLAEHIEMLSTVEKDRHYEIYDATDLTASYPYKLNDYAVNVINTTVQGYVLSSATGSIDANVKKNDDGTVTI